MRMWKLLAFAVAAGAHLSVYAMNLEQALAVVQSWVDESRASARDIQGSLTADPSGAFSVLVRGAVFRYEPKEQRLSISGVVRYNLKNFSASPYLWEKLKEVGRREYTSMMYGEAAFELRRDPLFNLEPELILLTKQYLEPPTREQARVQIRWLLSDARYWFVTRYNEVIGGDEAELARQADAKNAWMLANRPKPW